MSFDNGCGEVSSMSMKDCKPDYEAQAATLKVKLDSTVQLELALFDFNEKNGSYRFSNISSFAEMLGGIAITRHEQEKSYAVLLAEIEKA